MTASPDSASTALLLREGLPPQYRPCGSLGNGMTSEIVAKCVSGGVGGRVRFGMISLACHLLMNYSYHNNRWSIYSQGLKSPKKGIQSLLNVGF